MIETIKSIHIVEKEANERGELFTRLMKGLFLTLGYDNLRINIHKLGYEMEMEAVFRTEKKRMFAECKVRIKNKLN